VGTQIATRGRPEDGPYPYRGGRFATLKDVVDGSVGMAVLRSVTSPVRRARKRDPMRSMTLQERSDFETFMARRLVEFVGGEPPAADVPAAAAMGTVDDGPAQLTAFDGDPVPLTVVAGEPVQATAGDFWPAATPSDALEPTTKALIVFGSAAAPRDAAERTDSPPFVVPAAESASK